jgi:hypothetical protein
VSKKFQAVEGGVLDEANNPLFVFANMQLLDLFKVNKGGPKNGPALCTGCCM